MNYLKIALMALLVVVGISNANAQDNNNPWAIDFGVNAVDFYPTNPQTNWGGNWYNEFANARDHYNIIPAISRISVTRYLTNGFSLGLAGSLNKINKIGDMEEDDLSYFGLDGSVKYDLNKIIGDTKWFDPFAIAGGGYTWMDSNGAGTANAGLGANIWFNDNVGLTVQSAYKHSFDDDIFYPHFQHSAGIVIKFGGNDADGDGISNEDDACPDVYGLAEFNGCPDTDGDGIVDSEDACPNASGSAESNGCPDTDNDGIADNKDACPNEKGSKANNGCPDTDGDGIINKNDGCPNVAGPGANKGCPWPDTDKDGVLDKDDDCVNVAGPASNNGCPKKITKEAAKHMNSIAKTILFNTGKATFKVGVVSQLNGIADIMKSFDSGSLIIEGYTDSVGSAINNLKLSQVRANAVRDYLIKKGVSADRLTAKGFGEDYPVDTNSTNSGRENNRRVEIKM